MENEKLLSHPAINKLILPNKSISKPLDTLTSIPGGLLIIL